MIVNDENYSKVKELERNIKYLEEFCCIHGTNCFEFMQMMNLTHKLNQITKPQKHYPNKNTNQLI